MKSGASYHNLGWRVHAQICADVSRTAAEIHRTSYRTAFMVCAAMVLSGCVNSTEVYTADGRKGFAITCSGAGLYGTYIASWNQCHERAGEICGARGFDILEKVGEAGIAGGASYGQYGGGSSFSTTQNRSMIVRCKA